MKKVLLVDDEAYIMDMLSRMIPWDFYGFEVTGRAENAAEAMRMFHALHPDLVISDICMENVSGIELITRIRMLDPKVKILILSAYDRFEYAQKAVRLNVDGYLLKPINREEITATLAALQKEMEEEAQRVGRLDDLQNSLNYYQEKYLEEKLTKLYLGMAKRLPEELQDGGYWCVLSIEALERSYIMFLEQDIRDEHGIECHTMFTGDGYSAFFLKAASRENLEQCIARLREKHTVEERKLLCGRSYVSTECDSLMCRNSTLALRSLFYMKTPVNFSGCSRREMEQEDAPDTAEECSREQFLIRIANRDFAYCRELVKRWKNQCVQCRRDRRTVCGQTMDYLGWMKEMTGGTQALWEFETLMNRAGQMIHITEAEYILEEGFRLLEQANISHGKNEILVEKANEFIKQNCCREDFSVEELAEYLRLSKSYLSKIYKDEMGESIWNHVVRVRIAKAKEMLIDTDATNFMIAKEIGYTSEYHFSRAFSKAVGVPPSVYKKMYMNQRI